MISHQFIPTQAKSIHQQAEQVRQLRHFSCWPSQQRARLVHSIMITVCESEVFSDDGECAV